MQMPAPVQAFQYFDGEGIVLADPWPIYREIMVRTSGQPNVLADRVKAVKAETTDVTVIMEGLEASKLLEQLVRELFVMKPFNPKTGTGAMWPHCFAVWEQYSTYMNELKKKAETLQTTAPSGDSSQASSQPTNSGSV